MPCDTVRVVTVARFDALDFDRLQKAAETVSLIVRRTGRETEVAVLDMYGNAANAAEVAKLRSAYAAETVKAGLKRFGWKVKTQVTETEERVGVVTRLKAGR
jgi:hypothetical protein